MTQGAVADLSREVAREECAAHEAGHAICAVAFKVPFDCCEIDLVVGEDGAAGALAPLYSPWSEWTPVLTKRYLAMAAGGHYGVVLLINDERAQYMAAEGCCDGDIEYCDMIAAQCWKTSKARERNIKQGQIAAYWTLVNLTKSLAALAGELLANGRLSEKAVRDIIKREDHRIPDYRALLSLSKPGA